jgi:hypothetical protein
MRGIVRCVQGRFKHGGASRMRTNQTSRTSKLAHGSTTFSLCISLLRDSAYDFVLPFVGLKNSAELPAEDEIANRSVSGKLLRLHFRHLPHLRSFIRHYVKGFSPVRARFTSVRRIFTKLKLDSFLDSTSFVSVNHSANNSNFNIINPLFGSRKVAMGLGERDHSRGMNYRTLAAP